MNAKYNEESSASYKYNRQKKNGYPDGGYNHKCCDNKALQADLSKYESSLQKLQLVVFKDL